MSKLDSEDGINEKWWDKEMAKPIVDNVDFPIPHLKPVKAKAVDLDPVAWGEGMDQDDPLERFWSDAHATLVAIRNLADSDRAVNQLPLWTFSLLRAAQDALETFFPKDDDEGGPF